MGMPIPLQYQYKIQVSKVYYRTIEGNKEDTLRLVNYDIKDNDYTSWDFHHSSVELLEVKRKDELDD
jgi:hypothetical protein